MSSLQTILSKRLFAITLLFRFSNAFWPFPSERFSGNSLLEAGKLGLNSEGRVIAFGDFNGDQFLDVVILGTDEQTLSIYLWNHNEFKFQSSSSLRHPQQIYNVVPGDFTHDGTLDLLVMSRSPASQTLNMALYTGIDSTSGSFETQPLKIPSSNLAQPIPLDADGSMKIDLLGITPNSQSFTLWRNSWNESESNSHIFDLVDAPFNGIHCDISNPHSNAVVDLNGDCLADVFLVCDEPNSNRKSFQIWTNEKSQGFSLALTGVLPAGIQSISFADMDRDGTIDMVFSTCESVSSSTGIGSNCVINVAYNQQLPLCTAPGVSGVQNGERVCRPPEQLCMADPNFRFDLSKNASPDAISRVPISTLFPSTQETSPSLLVLDTTTSPAIPIPIKLGDANMDGFPDLLFITASVSHGGFLGVGAKADQIPHLAFSVPCSRGVAGCDTHGNGHRGWSVLQDGAEELTAITDARSVSFLDLDEDGTLDILVQRTGRQGQGNVFFVQNNIFYDAFFLKAIVLNGACDNGYCTNANGTKHYHPFGVSYPGASYKYTVLDTSGQRSAAQVGQLPQTSYQALLTPYSFFGLGRTNNYIENLFVGSTKQTEQHFINMEGVIPNSKVVIYPSMDDGPWRRELYLRPGSWIPWVTLTVLATAILLAIIVFILRLNEKREDELERRKASHHINFDAL